MLKIYEYNGATFQFEEGTQPDGAVEKKQEKAAETQPEMKNRKPPANKARTVKGK